MTQKKTDPRWHFKKSPFYDKRTKVFNEKSGKEKYDLFGRIKSMSDGSSLPTTHQEASTKSPPAFEKPCQLRDDDLGSSDEVKVFKDEGEGEEDFEGCFGANEELQAALLEDKSLLIQETENLSIKDEFAALGSSHHLLQHHSGKELSHKLI